jgi:transcriptional regulator with XRE-family HTH domain
MKASELVKAAMAQTKVSSRYALAKITGVSERHLSYYVKNERWPDNNHARLLAEAAGLNPLKTIAELEMSRAEDESTRTAWGKALASVTGKAVMVLLAVFVTVTAISGPSLTTTKVVVFAHLIDDNFYYVNLKSNGYAPERNVFSFLGLHSQMAGVCLSFGHRCLCAALLPYPTSAASACVQVSETTSFGACLPQLILTNNRWRSLSPSSANSTSVSTTAGAEPPLSRNTVSTKRSPLRPLSISVLIIGI